MQDPYKYKIGNQNQITDTKATLFELLPCLKEMWKNGDSFLDIGCGDGEVTVHLLKPLLPLYKKFTAVDISPEMINYAKNHFGKSDIKFEIMDIVNEPHFNHLQQYNHIFSFFCLHWIQDQRKALKNVYNLMKKDGDFLFMLIANHPLYSIWEKLSKCSKWKPYMQNIKKYISPYRESQNPIEKLNENLEIAGFKIINSECQKKVFKFENTQKFKNFASAICPFLNEIPQHLHNEYMDCCVKLMMDIEFTKNCDNINKEGKIYTSYSVLSAFVIK